MHLNGDMSEAHKTRNTTNIAFEQQLKQIARFLTGELLNQGFSPKLLKAQRL